MHIIELSSTVHGRYNDDTLPNVLVNLSSRSRTSSVRHVVLVLKAESPVHWHISIQRLHCSLDVIVSTYVLSYDHCSDGDDTDSHDDDEEDGGGGHGRDSDAVDGGGAWVALSW